MLRNLTLIKKTQLKSVFITIAALVFLNGCAHQRFLDEGQRYSQTNQYEAAVEQFNLALNEKPNDIETQNKLAEAKKNLHNWATSLESKADIALQNKHLGKALLLYGKSAQVTRNPYSVKHYKELYSKLRSESVITAKILPNKLGFANSTLNGIDGISFQKKAKIALKFSQSNPAFNIHKSTQDEVLEYISGSQLIANPELINLQTKLQNIKYKLRSSNRGIRNLRKKNSSINELTNKLSNELQRVELLLNKTNSSEEKYASYNKQTSDLRRQLLSAKKKALSTKKKLNNAEKLHQKLGRVSNHIANDLAYTSPVAEAPVYSDYIYQKFEQTNLISGALYLRVNNTTRTASVSASSTDVSHSAHPTINLANNPMIILSQQKLTPLYNAERFNMGLRLINELIEEHKSSFLAKAQNSNDLEHKLTLLVQHGLVKRNGALGEALAMLNDILITEFGRAGIFNLNQLLNLY